MTICIGWTDDRAVYLAADSAVTSNMPLADEYSTFGERHHRQENVSVREGALKIMRHQNSAVAFSGDANRGIEIFENFIMLSGYFPTREAYESAWVNAHDSANPKNNRALLAYCDLNGPHLIRFDASSTKPGEEIRSACIGNVSSSLAFTFGEALTHMPSHITTSMDALINGVCLLQRFFIFENLMPKHAIGGFVAGCLINNDGLMWAADTLHVLTRNGLVDQLSNETLNTIAIFERRDTFFAYNNQVCSYTGFTTSFGANSGLGWAEVISKLQECELLPSDPCKLPIAYIVFHDLTTGFSTIFNVTEDNNRYLKYRFREDVSRRRDIQFNVYGAGVKILKRSFPQEGVIAFIGQ